MSCPGGNGVVGDQHRWLHQWMEGRGGWYRGVPTARSAFGQDSNEGGTFRRPVATAMMVANSGDRVFNPRRQW